jgi:hypothetical protein
MTNEYLSFNDDKGRVSRDSLHRCIGFTGQRFNDLLQQPKCP